MANIEKEIEALRAGLVYVAERLVALENETAEMQHYLTTEILKCGISSIKDREGLGKFRGYLTSKFKSDYEKFEDLYSKQKSLSKRSKKRYAYE